MRRLSVFLAAALAAFLGADEKPTAKAEPKSPFSPKDAQSLFKLDPGLRIELVASEPLIESPVAMAFDEDGRLFVVEMRDYPNGPAPGQPPQGRIKLLEDTKGDGKYDKATVWADNLSFANGLLPWKGGLIVTAAPHILYLKDTDGDGKADKREILYEGFKAENPQLRVSHPILGLDGWVYVANGLRGGSVRKAGMKDAPLVDISNRDFRFNMLDGRYEALSGPGQFGNTFDEWGRRFVCDNRHHLRHVVLEDRYVKRNPFLAVPAVVEDISILDDGPLSSGGKIYPISKNWTTSNLHAGRFTAACGVYIYRDDLLGPKYKGSAFTCDPTGNLVHQEVLSPKGVTFQSKPGRDGVEFLASPDEWFRPVFLTDGPDGALYIVDMYRAVIEHPEYMPTELKKRPDLTLGKERGRIWRIVPDKKPVTWKKPQLGKSTNAALADALGSDIAWERRMAHRVLVERHDPSIVEKLARLTTGDNESGRLYALWLLDSLGALDEKMLAGRLTEEKKPEICESAVAIAEKWIAKSETVQKALGKLSTDGNPRIRFQIALAMGEWDSRGIELPLIIIAANHWQDKWMRLAVACSASKRAGSLLWGLSQIISTEVVPERDRLAELALWRELCAQVGARQDPMEIVEVLHSFIHTERHHVRLPGLEGLADGMGRRGTQLAAFLKTLPEADRKLADDVSKLLQTAAVTATDAKRDAADRLTAVRLLAHTSWSTAEKPLAKLFTDETTQDIRLAAVRSLGAHRDPAVAPLLLKGWSAYTPAVRREVVEAMVRQQDRLLLLLGEIEKGKIKPGDIDAVRARQLVAHPNADVRAKAIKVLKASLPADRQKVIDEYKASLKLDGDTRRGKEVFRKHCATCHRVGDVGVDVGADISDTRTKTPEMLLTDILNPNAAIDSNYVNYVVSTKSGKTLTGIIATETASSITLKRAENQTDVVLRQDIEEITSSGVSLMPEGQEKNVSVAEMADLIAFLKNWRYPDGKPPKGP